MPYNTRRKSLSLPSLGIVLPNHSRAHRSNSKSSSSDGPAQPPAKRMKRSHDEEPLSPVSPPPNPSRRVIEQTPPPEPSDATYRKVDTDGINDDIVVAVIEQLEKTGNRPHLIKELATVLANSTDSIAQYVIGTQGKYCTDLRSSANPAALLSSRLSLYLKRPWTALSPCPLSKELMDVHPRKVFFFLTTMPRQPLPESSDDIITPDIKRLTPSISDPSVEEEESDRRERDRFSPSPEIDLFSPELDSCSMPSTPGESFSVRTNPEVEVRISVPNAPSPSLEADEKGFTETATAVRKMRNTQPSKHHDEDHQLQKHDYGFDFFGSNQSLTIEQKIPMMLTSSPMINARQASMKMHLDLDLDMIDVGLNSWNLLSPESIDVDELDEMFTDY